MGLEGLSLGFGASEREGKGERKSSLRMSGRRPGVTPATGSRRAVWGTLPPVRTKGVGACPVSQGIRSPGTLLRKEDLTGRRGQQSEPPVATAPVTPVLGAARDTRPRGRPDLPVQRSPASVAPGPGAPVSVECLTSRGGAEAAMPAPGSGRGHGGFAQSPAAHLPRGPVLTGPDQYRPTAWSVGTPVLKDTVGPPRALSLESSR